MALEVGGSDASRSAARTSSTAQPAAQPAKAEQPAQQTASLETPARESAAQSVVDGARAAFQNAGSALMQKLNDALGNGEGGDQGNTPEPQEVAGKIKICGRGGRCMAQNTPTRGLGGPTSSFG